MTAKVGPGIGLPFSNFHKSQNVKKSVSRVLLATVTPNQVFFMFISSKNSKLKTEVKSRVFLGGVLFSFHLKAKMNEHILDQEFIEI